MFAIGEHETQWTHEAIGKSGEKGALQFLSQTWESWSKEVLGYVAPMTEVNEKFVALLKVENWLNQGYSEREIALMWNQGSPGPCRAGINKKGIEYDSCQYAKQVLALLTQ